MVTQAARACSVIGAAVLLLAASGAVAPAHAADLPPGCTGAATPGNDTITCTENLTDGMVIDAGDGDDTITVKADVQQGAAVRGGTGTDTIAVYDVGGFACDPEEGATGLVGGALDGGDGDDLITVSQGQRPEACADAVPASVPAGNVGRNADVRGGAGDDTILVGSLGYIYQPDENEPGLPSVAHGGRLAGDAGNDTITAVWATYGENPSSHDGVFGGAGDDTITMGTISGIVDIMGDTAQTGPDTGNDTITISVGMGGLVYGGPGDDTINATSGDMKFTTRLWGDEGNDTITATNLDDAANIFGGDGNDTLSATTMDQEADGGAVIAGGNGDDTIDAGLIGGEWSEIRGDGQQGDTDPNVGTGRDTITVDTNRGAINAGNDDDTLTVNLNEGKVDGGAGTDTCTITQESQQGTNTGCDKT